MFTAVLLLIFSMLGPVTLQAASLTMIYSGNLNGELEPCGCSEEGDLGGIRRRATAVASLREQHRQPVLLSSGGLISHESSQDRIKGKYILSGLATMAYDAIGVQWRDLAFGQSLLTGADLPFVVSNWKDDSFTASRTLTREGVTLEIFSWLDAEQDPARAMQAGQPQVSSDTSMLTQRLQQARAQRQLTVLLTSMPLEKARALLPLQHIDILVIESQHELFAEPQQLDSTLVLQPGSRGMRLGKLQLQLDDNLRLSSFKHEVITLPASVADAPQLADWYEAYNQEVKAEYLKKVELRKALRSGTSPYAGEEACAGCHAAAHKTWSDSEHAKAYADLEKVGKSFDPECLQCHTVGLDQEGGFIDMKLTPHLVNVQCENCHGAAQAHVESSGARPPANAGWTPEKMCRQCHIGSHSPVFSLDKYWPRIVHGK